MEWHAGPLANFCKNPVPDLVWMRLVEVDMVAGDGSGFTAVDPSAWFKRPSTMSIDTVQKKHRDMLT